MKEKEDLGEIEALRKELKECQESLHEARERERMFSCLLNERKQQDDTIIGLNQALERRVLELSSLAEDLRQAHDQALESSRLKSEFVANISHEIRTPISALIGLTELLLETELNQSQRELLELTFESSRALLVIINDILDFSKIEAAKIQLDLVPFDLARVIIGSAELLSEAANDKDLALSFHLDQALPKQLQGEPLRLRQVLINLLSNAIKFTDTGAIQLRAILLGKDAEVHTVKFEIQDTGIGISRETQDQLFLPFMQIDSSPAVRRGGTGLGLAISKRLVELMGGEIGVESELEQGSTFWFTVPLNAVTETPTAEPSSRSQKRLSAQPSAGEILLVEDSPVLQKLTLQQLAKLGFKADTVRTGKEAIEAVKTKPYAVVLMDCQIPEIDGYQATRMIRENENSNGRRTPIVAITASAMFGDKEKCLAAGMDDYLSKPVNLDQLIGVLERWIPSTAPDTV